MSILKNTILTGLFAVLFIPFIVADSQLFPFITGKAFTFRIGVEILFVLWILLGLRRREFLPKFSWILFSAAIFVTIIGIADIFGVNPYKSFWSNYERMEGFFTLLHVFIYFLMVGSVLNTQKLWTAFLNVSVGSSVIMCVYGLLQLAGKITINQGGVRLDGTMGNAIYLAVYMLFNIFFAAFLFLRVRGWPWWRFVYLPVITLQLIVLYNTASRGVVLGLIGGALLSAVLIAIFEKQNKKSRRAAIVSLIALFVIIGGFWAIRDASFVTNSPVLQRFASLSFSELKTQGRYYVWPMAVQGFKERPILGWGQEGFNHVFNKYYNPAMYNQEPWFDRTHNAFLDWLIAGGILGLLSYLAILAAFVWYLLRSNFSVSEKAVLAGLFAAYIFQSIFVFDNLFGYILLFSLFAFVHGKSVGLLDGFAAQKPISWLDRLAQNALLSQRVIVPLAAIVAIFAVYFVNVKPLLANRELIRAIAPETKIAGKLIRWSPDESLKHFKNVFARNTFGNSEALEQMMFNIGKFQSAEVLTSTRSEFNSEILKRFEEQIKKTPEDTRYLLFYGSVLNRLGLFAEAVPVLEKALETSPKKQQVFFELGVSLINNGNRERAFEMFKAAYELAPEYAEAQLLYALSAIYVKDFKLADSLFAALDQSKFAFEERVIAAYAAVGEFSRAAQVLKLRISLDGNNPQNYFSLAAAYLKLGNRPAAIAELRKVAEIEPKVKDQAEFYIKEIQAGRNP